MQSLIRRFAPGLVALACATSPPLAAAPIDAIADAVIGKPGFDAPAGGAASADNFLRPSALAEDPVSGELWVADANAHRVLRFASARAFANGEAANLVLGQADFAGAAPNRGGAAGPGTLATPAGLAVDGARRLYVSDANNHRVLVFKPPYANGMDASNVFGQGNLVSAARNRNSGTPRADGLDTPQGIALDPEGRLWVADGFNARVVRTSAPVTVNGLRADVILGQPSEVSNAPALTATGMRVPTGVALDPEGNVWVADFLWHRVTRYAAPAPGTLGPPADRVLCQLGPLSSVTGAGDSRCNMPTGVAVDAEGRVHVTDLGNSRVLMFASPDLAPIATGWIGQATADGALCNGGAAQPSARSLCAPLSASLDRHGDLLVADSGNGRVLRFDSPFLRNPSEATSLSPSTIARGTGDFDLTVNGSGFYGDSVVHWNGQPRPTRYVSGERLVARIAGADVAAAGHAEILVMTPAPFGGPSGLLGAFIADRQAGDGIADLVLGQPDLFASVVLNRRVGAQALGTANPASLPANLRSVAIDPATGRLFVADGRARVLSWPGLANLQNGEAADVVVGRPDAFTLDCDDMAPTATIVCDPWGLAVDAGGRLYVSEPARHRVLRFDPPHRTGMAAARVFGQGGSFTTFTRNKGGIGPGSLSEPSGLATSGNRLFIHDGGNARILVFDDPDAVANANAVIGQPDMVTAAVQAPSATRLGGGPGGLAVDRDGRLFLADGANARVLRFAPPFANGMPADLVIGQAGFTTNGSGLSASNLRLPAAVAVSRGGDLLVADGGNHRVLRFAAPLATGMAATRVLGQPAFNTDMPVASPEGLGTPVGVAIDAGGNVVVADSGNARVLAYDRPFGGTAPSPGRVVNLSTRMAVLTGNDVMIGGFIVGGTQPKRVVIRARGPSLAAAGVPNVLANPLLQLFAGPTPIAANDDWRVAANAADVQASGFAPSNDREGAILATLAPGAYTAIVSGVAGTTGVGLVEVFEVDLPASPLVNIATRGRVLTGNDVMIAGFVIQGDLPQKVVIRARGPSLAAQGVPGVLANPLLQVLSGATPVAVNDDWGLAANAAALQASGFAPADPREAAVLATLEPGAYTAIVTGAGSTTGVGIVEVFAIP
ncbi:MAG: hypothetical protein IPJ28_14740 [Betaproteobacteria bacterium]|nr:hypothetical protein [Betaproteobacteria bacterium]